MIKKRLYGRTMPFYFTLLFLLFSFSLQAQSWRWGKIGGGIYDVQNSNSREEVTHTATDNNGNVYAITRLTNSSYLMVDGHHITLPPSADGTLLFSFACDGSFRWAKLMQIGKVGGLGVDTLGGVYVSGNILNSTFFMGEIEDHDADTLFDIYSYNLQSLILVKLDTMGNKEWIKLPQPDTASWQSPQPISMDMEVEKDGTVHWMTWLTAGNYEGTGLIVTDRAIHVMRYNRFGNLTGSTPMAMVMPPTAIGCGWAKLNYSKNNNRYIVTGSRFGTDPSLTIDGTTVDQLLYVASFNATTGAAYWLRQSNSIYSIIQCKSAVDDQNNIYLTGKLGHGNSFNGFTLNNAYTTIPHTVPFIQKIDANGNAVWSHGSSGGGGINSLGITLSGNEVAMIGSYGGYFKWDNGSESFFSTGSTYGVNVFLTRFNTATGDYIDTDTLCGNNTGWEYPFSVAADHNGNYYVGGNFDNNIMFDSLPMYKAGGDLDFFLAKFGTDNCMEDTNTSSINEITDQNFLKVYPNPTLQTTTLLLNTGCSHATLRIVNIYGEIMLEKKDQSGNEFKLDISNYSPGLYFVEVMEPTHSWKTKLLKE